MSRHRQWIEELFHAALEREPGDREAYLAEACDDAAVRSTVRTLLDEDGAAAEWFAGLAGRAGALHERMQPHLEEGALAGRQVGAYILDGEVGRGGTSVVYAARRADGAFERTVAVKVLTRRSGGGELRERFHREQQVLSGLSHPNVAGIFDGGITEDGYPYFVMELVDGVPLDRYCDERRLTIDERLRLFLTVADAVHYAHRNLVIHRDLKPSNILVTRDGTVKLIDFGIARILSGERGSTDDATTRLMARWMTPQYGAPEQIRGERTTTATDVYQLGIVLYELLTGRSPVSAGAGASLYLTEKAVCETEPPRPSRAVTKPGGGRHGAIGEPLTAPEIARARRTDVRQLRDRLRGDVDAIVLCALQKDPALRYGSAEAFAGDIRRYLSGQPVEAREGKLRYRARKFVGRNRVAVTTAALVLLAFAAGGAFHTATIQEQRDVARLEATKARTVTDFMLDLFQASNPEEARGETLTAAMLLERGVTRAQELTVEPAVQAEMLITMARAYHGMAAFERSDELVARSLALRRQHFPADHPDVAHSLAHMGWSKLRLREFPAAAEYFREAASIQRPALGPEHSEVANSLHGLALALNGMGRVDEGLRYLEEAQAIRAKAWGGEPHAEVANGLNDMAILLRERGDFAAAERTLLDALAMRRGILGQGHPDIGKSALHLALLLHKMGRYADAEPLYLEALANWRHSLGPTHPATLSTVRSLVTLYDDMGRPEEAGRYVALMDP
jgi:eukaryotic-like serine/threonine-protein kinase